MSEEILKALMELFALIVKQDGGIIISERDYVTAFLTKQLSQESVTEYLTFFDEHAGPVRESSARKEPGPPSVKDSVKILGICKKINRTLNQEQKVVVLMRLFELVNADRRFTPQRMNIINTVAEVFRITAEEFTATEQFVRYDTPEKLDNNSILSLYPEHKECDLCKRMLSGYLDTSIFFLRITSVDLYFVKYRSDEQLYLNGLPIIPGQIYSFAKGSTLRSSQGYPIYYSDISSTFLSDIIIHKLSFSVENLTLKFIEGHHAIDDVSFSIDEGSLVGILGASGSGKTTLLNLLSGIEKPTSGSVKINGLDVINDNRALEGVLGFVPQDDLLMEDLTVFDNLYFAACQCFRNKSRKEITEIVDHTLSNLGLLDKRDLKVGSPFNKVISGGQRKRLNIALELIREPSILFLDEPTSGLSSRDSETLMDLLRDLTLKGKLIFTVIHQPSSEIFKMFDKIIILDQGGSMVYYGNPVNAVVHFKTLDAQINSQIGECPQCGNVNTEAIFNIIEAHVVDEFGQYTDKRKVLPREWAGKFRERHPLVNVPEVKEPPHKNLDRPGLLKQYLIYFIRDLKSKLANRQYIMLTLLEAPVLGFILSFIIRYIPNPDSDIYIFSENENIPIYIFMSLIVALFLGLTISAEEIFRDRKILKRERFLNLSRTSYLFSKITILVIISAVQSFLFISVANPILGLRGMFFYYWVALFTTAFCANMVGLNISASFNSAITIYIIIPLLIIPMMVLSGAMFPFDKLNRKIGSVEKVPVIAELMPTRWTYEALMVSQFKDNRYSTCEFTREGKTFYDLQKKISQADFNKVHRIPEIKRALDASIRDLRAYTIRTQDMSELPSNVKPPHLNRLPLVRNELEKMSSLYGLPQFPWTESLTDDRFNQNIADSVKAYLKRLDETFSRVSNAASDRKDTFYNLNRTALDKLRDEYYNFKLEEIVTKYYERNKILIYKNSIVQNTDPVYLDPSGKGFPRFRTHFFAPSKYFLGGRTDTFIFNTGLVLSSTIALYIILYFDLLGRAVRYFERLRLRKKLFRTLVK
ncbi:MAG TPA: ATP-binding cassette domain-containing protein [Bacteroidales bacterium]|nr:ATP-binding cassette domain-containing protein [Bacteroidales bacterium]HPJ58723.1 ATP-binding cassette domain-containing protein [Bacteroidales bacterium]HPR12410.1 ATP-binding cassette domain-containing protein [Bacteroidales bacterium]HRW84630.1 ATP-binding cassette domain-containing protein [Bacteroidales bacterium]